MAQLVEFGHIGAGAIDNIVAGALGRLSSGDRLLQLHLEFGQSIAQLGVGQRARHLRFDALRLVGLSFVVVLFRDFHRALSGGFGFLFFVLQVLLQRLNAHTPRSQFEPYLAKLGLQRGNLFVQRSGISSRGRRPAHGVEIVLDKPQVLFHLRQLLEQLRALLTQLFALLQRLIQRRCRCWR